MKACLENHSYSLGTDWKRQANGGAIGLKLTGAIAKVFMVWWCRTFGQTIRAATVNLGFELYLHMFYVDDHNLAMEELPPGSRYREGRVVIVPEEVDADCLLPGDLVMQEVANSICQFTPSKLTVHQQTPVDGCHYWIFSPGLSQTIASPGNSMKRRCPAPTLSLIVALFQRR